MNQISGPCEQSEVKINKFTSLPLCFLSTYSIHSWLYFLVNKCALTKFHKTFFLISAKAVPFRMEFYSDGYEVSSDDAEDDANTTKGLYVRYFQTTC